MNDAMAVITLDPKTRMIKDLKLEQFWFKCKRCAALCCKLGGPTLTRNDTERLEDAGYLAKDFLEPINRTDKGLHLVYVRLKPREDGLCIFLQQYFERNCFKCCIYEFRSALCMLFPFSFERLDSNRVALKFIPCCMGLNNPEGKVLDKEFVSNSLLEPLLEAIELLKKDTLL